MEAVIKEHAHFKTDRRCVWNMDESEIDVSGQSRKMYCPAGRASTGFELNPHSTNGCHVTCVVTNSPCGKKLLPLFIVSRKMVTKRCWSPLRRLVNRTETLPDNIAKYFQVDWMNEDAGIFLSENGSMTKEILPLYIERFVRNVRKIATDVSLPLFLLLDGHKSKRV